MKNPRKQRPNSKRFIYNQHNLFQNQWRYPVGPTALWRVESQNTLLHSFFFKLDQQNSGRKINTVVHNEILQRTVPDMNTLEILQFPVRYSRKRHPKTWQMDKTVVILFSSHTTIMSHADFKLHNM
jgi:hypothetical protein